LFDSDEEYKEYESLLDKLNELTSTEQKILKLVLEAKSSEEIADVIFVSTKSVNNYRNRICRKLDLPAQNNALNRWLMQNSSALNVFYS